MKNKTQGRASIFISIFISICAILISILAIRRTMIQDSEMLYVVEQMINLQEKHKSEIEALIEDKIKDKKDEEKPFVSVDQMPQFPGGQPELMKFISQNLQYPSIAVENGIEGRVIIRFVVGKDGEVSDVEVQKGLDSSCDKEAIRVVAMMPKWTPGKHNGRKVPVYFTLPISFKLKK